MWQPSETAPKDGTPFLGLFRYALQPEWIEEIVVKWDCPKDELSFFKSGYPWASLDGGDRMVTNALIGWMPLPPPPKEPQ